MTKLKLAPLLGAVLALPGGVALAQTPPAAEAQSQNQNQTPAPAQDDEDKGQDEPAAVGDVVVSARTSEVRSSIDSISYSLANDLQATTGSLADALRNVPSVNVDPEGNVSLRGDSSVTILVDGQPSGILSGQSRGQAVLQLPADRYARIEVMTNPSAVYSPEGSGGIINLITKPTAPRPGQTSMGSIKLNVGDDGRWNAGVNGSWQKDRLTLSGDLSYRSDPLEMQHLRRREQLSSTGAIVSTTTSDRVFDVVQSGTIARFSAQYKLTDRTQLTAELRGVFFDGEGDNLGLYETRDAAGQLTQAYTRDVATAFGFDNWGATLRLLHQFDTSGHEWTNSLRYDNNSSENWVETAHDVLTPVSPSFFERQDFNREQVTIGLTSAYVRPLSDGGKLRLGYELSSQSPEDRSVLRRGPTQASMVVIPDYTSSFEGEQTVHALYGAYERPYGEKLSVQAGLRLEQADISITDRIANVSASQDYFKAYPTGHVQYLLSETQTLRASYSRRIQRPQLSRLNPAVLYQDPLQLISGNPDLKPQETDSIEAMWQVRKGRNFYQATAYLRDTDKAFTDVATDLGGGVILTRPENLGSSRNMGVELVASGGLHATLRYNASVNLYRQEIDAADIVGGRDRSGDVVSGSVSLNWQPTSRDFVQVTGFWQGDTLLAQGVQEAGGMVNLGYRRKLTDDLSLNLTARDVFNSFKSAVDYDTPMFRDRFEQNLSLRAFYIGLTWNFGNSARRQPEQFDFSTGPTGG